MGLGEEACRLLRDALTVNETWEEFDLTSSLLGNNGTALVLQGIHDNKTIRSCPFQASQSGAALGAMLLENDILECLNQPHSYLGDDGVNQLVQGLEQNRSLRSPKLNK